MYSVHWHPDGLSASMNESPTQDIRISQLLDGRGTILIEFEEEQDDGRWKIIRMEFQPESLKELIKILKHFDDHPKVGEEYT